MTVKISHTAEVQQFFEEAAGFGNDAGSPRLKRIVQRVLQDTARLIEDLEISEDEFWYAVDYLNRLGGRGEAGLLVAGLGIEHFLDLLQDAKDQQAGLVGGTPRTIEGPLYVAGAPIAEGEVRMDDGSEEGVATPMYLEGQVLRPTKGGRCLGPRLTCGMPIPVAPIRSSTRASPSTTCAGASSPMAKAATAHAPSCRPGMAAIHRGRPRSAWTCSAVTASVRRMCTSSSRHRGYRHLTTQINLAGDKYLWDDFAYATRDGLVGEVVFVEGEAGRHAELKFDFQLQQARGGADEQRSGRPRALQEA
ncbi:catechol 1,2-dioxygenase [Pseudomonas putida S11]|nr:catechol 1,2-dioxygenase [Pseudomonas putida S11]